MSEACPALLDEGLVRSVLGTVDCQTRVFAEGGYQALAGAVSPFQTVLTLLLTIYVAVWGYRLLFGSAGARLGDAAGVALKIGAVLVLATNWSAFQTLVFDVAAKAPLDVATAVVRPLASGDSALAASPVTGLQLAYDELREDQRAFARQANRPAAAETPVAPQAPKGAAEASDEASAARALGLAAQSLIAFTVGPAAAASLIIGVLTATGPVFVALFLFWETRGLFVGWLRALAAAAFAPMGVWIVATIALAALEPWLTTLAQQRDAEALEPSAALTAATLALVFSFAELAVVAALAVAALGLRLPDRARRAPSAAEPQERPAPSRLQAPELTRAQALSETLRTLDIRRASRIEERRLSLATPAGALAGGERLGDAFRRASPRPRRTR